MGWVALGYFAAYIPYVALTKAMAEGYLPGVGSHRGLVLLPAAAIGQLLVMPLFLGVSGWWRYGSRRRAFGRRIFCPRRGTLTAGFFTAVIIGTTTLNLTFPGVSILFMLLMMRAGTLIVAPVVDQAGGRHVHGYAWAALGFSLAAVAIALADVGDYTLTGWAVLSLAAYLAGYVGRFQLMGRWAKTGVKEVDRRYFAGEHAAAPVVLLTLLAVGALLGQPDLREGFTTFLTSPGALPAIGIGILYEALFVFGTLIYLDTDEYAWTVPVNRCASLLSGLVASLALAAVTPAARKALPGKGQLLALVAVVGAVVTLCYPAIRRRITYGSAARSAGRPAPRTILFVCGGNTCRSPMAEAIAREEIAITRSARLLTVASAGLKIRTVGGSMTSAAVAALGDLGIEVRHRARALTPEICRTANAIYCMTRRQRDEVLAMAPECADRTFCLDPRADIDDPSGQPVAEHRQFALRLQPLVRAAVAEQLAVSAPSAK